MKYIKTILLVLILGTLGIGCRASKKGSVTKNIPTVEVIKILPRTVYRTTTLFGTIYGEEQVVVTPKTVGRVTKILKPEGSIVNSNDTILYILNDIPGMEYQPAPVLSPISGVIGKIYVDFGQMVTQSTPVALVSKYHERVRIKAPISETDLRFIKKGIRAVITVTSLPDLQFEGVVSNISAVVDPIVGSATVEITVPNRNQKLIPGMACEINLLLDKKDDVLALPLNALLTNTSLSTDTASVFIVDNEFRARRKNITLGIIGNQWAEIKSGLNLNERVITTGKERISEGDSLNIIEVNL
ncbi:MAG: efflux RND transporter periplasmic adaptor subunit [candidate division WOR-3 bacterium]|nr:efflux RND transporter periplasmic adaptor subunit [candidate division WOR-3 bacterium]MCX7757078.1 efflux RND transporter periplasmic adaptor subunit [candidate division WOR-3 bacterium]MDW7987574.1 efflux RND transporter periplasmic adaptor subunit [candidate division WOR-3 bacterium]